MFKVRTMLVPTDSARVRALAHALHLAGRFRADVHLLYVTEQEAPEAGGRLSRLLTEETDLFEHSRSVGEDEQDSSRSELWPVRAVEVQRVAPSPAAGILAYAAEHDADLIVMGTHGRRGLDRLLIGSTKSSDGRGAPY